MKNLIFKGLNGPFKIATATQYITRIKDSTNKRVISTFKFGCPHLTLKEGPKVKSDHTRRFPAHDFLYAGLPSQTSRTNNKRVISTFKFACPRLTLKKGPQDQIRP